MTQAQTQPDHDAWLDEARNALAPQADDQARVLAALEQRLQLPSNYPPGAAKRWHSGQKAVFKVPSVLWRWSLGALVLTGGVMLVTTYSAAPATSTRPRQPVAAAVSPELLDRALTEVAEVKVKDAPPVTEPALTPDAPPRDRPHDKKPTRKKCRTSQGHERPCATVRSSATALASAEAPLVQPEAAAKPAASLSRELAALRQAQSALRAGHAAQALEALSSFEREAPGPGAMQEERSAAATMARCVLATRGDAANGSPRELYESYLRHFPQSAYAARLERTCLPKP